MIFVYKHDHSGALYGKPGLKSDHLCKINVVNWNAVERWRGIKQVSVFSTAHWTRCFAVHCLVFELWDDVTCAVYHYCSWATVLMTVCQHADVTMTAPCPGHRMGWGDEKCLAARFCAHIVSLCWQDETGSKLDGRGDSAVSKGTADSGVVMEENRELPVLPGALPRKLPPLSRVGESEADRVAEDGECLPRTRWINQPASHCRNNNNNKLISQSGINKVILFCSMILLWREYNARNLKCYCFVRLWGLRQHSSKILEELLNEGIIPVGQRGSAAGEAYSIMVSNRCSLNNSETCKHHLSTRSAGCVTLE